MHLRVIESLGSPKLWVGSPCMDGKRVKMESCRKRGWEEWFVASDGENRTKRDGEDTKSREKKTTKVSKLSATKPCHLCYLECFKYIMSKRSFSSCFSLCQNYFYGPCCHSNVTS